MLLRSAKSIVKKTLTTYRKTVQVVLGKTNREFKFPVDESCASSHHPSTAIISESSFPVSVIASPLGVFGASPGPHLTSAGLFLKLETRIHICSHAGDFPTVGRVATSLLSSWFIQNSQTVQSNLCKHRIWPMAPHVFNGGLRDKQTDPVIM